MNYTYLRVFIENYSLPTLVISGIVAIFTLLYDKFLADKLPAIIRNFLPFILSTVLYYAYDMIFVLNRFNFSAGTFSAGILSGSLSVIITTSIYRLKNGKPLSLNTRALIIENILTGLIKQELLHVTINEIIGVLDSEIIDKEQEIINTVKKNLEIEMQLDELKAISELILKAVLTVEQK